MGDAEPRYIVYRNSCSEEDYMELTSMMEGLNYREVESDEIFNTSTISGEPVLGVRTSIGVIPKTGWSAINETLETLEEDHFSRQSSATG